MNQSHLEKTTWTTEEIISLAKQYYANGETQKVETLCNNLLSQAHGQESEMFWIVGLIGYEIGQPDVAIRYLEESVKIVATSERYEILAKVYLHFKRYEEALYCLCKVMEPQPLFVDKLLRYSEQQLNSFEKWQETAYLYLTVKQGKAVLGKPVSVKYWCESHQMNYHCVFPQQEIMVKKPKNIVGDFMPVDEGITFSNELYVAEITNARIFYRNNLILIDNQTILCDNLAHPLGNMVLLQDSVCKSSFQDTLLIDYFDFETVRCACGIMMSGFASEHFGHWMFEYLPKWQCYEYLEEYKKYPVYVDAGMPATHYESLRMLIGREREVIQIPANVSMVFDKLVVAPTQAFMPTNLKQNVPFNRHIFPTSVLTLHYLQRRLCDTAKLTLEPSRKSGRKIYLSRRKASPWRILLNEQDIISFLRNNYGFEEVFLEEMSFLEQMKTLNSADFVVAPGGSATCHFLFCRENCKIILLISEILANYPTFSSAIGEIGHPHWIICGTSEGSPHKHANFSVSLRLLEQAIEHCLS